MKEPENKRKKKEREGGREEGRKEKTLAKIMKIFYFFLYFRLYVQVHDLSQIDFSELSEIRIKVLSFSHKNIHITDYRKNKLIERSCF